MKQVKTRVRAEIPEPPKKKMQFSKAHVIYANTIVAFSFVFSYTLNFILAWHDRTQIDLAVPLAIIGAYGAFATGGYFVQNCIRDTSLNKLKGKLNEHTEE